MERPRAACGVLWMLFVFHSLLGPCVASEVVVLTDANFDGLVRGRGGTWLIDVYSPGCLYCKQLEPVWNELAGRLEGLVYVAKIDGTAERGLLRRFAVEAYPSIFLIEGGTTRMFTGLRTADQLEEFARGGYRAVEPLPFYRSPTSAFGRMLSMLYTLPAQIRAGAMYLHEEKKYSTLTLLAGALAIPVILGLLLIMALDNFFGRGMQPRVPHHVHVD